MKRALIGVGIAVVALAGAVAASQAQAPQDPQRGIGPGGPPEFRCGPARGVDDQVAPPQGAVRGRGPGGGRLGAFGRPGGRGGPGGPGGFDRALCSLGLTEEQQAQIAAIHRKTREEIEAVLTPEQKEKLRDRRGGR